jgi:multidrug efflux system outer membrane protein
MIVRKELIALLLLSGCLSPPKYDYTVPTNEQWRYGKDENPVQEYDIAAWSHDPALQELVEAAIASNQDLKIAMARVAQYYSQYEINRSFLFPEINGTSQAYKLQNTLATVPGYPIGVPRTIDDFTLFANLVYELDIWGKLSNRTEAALEQWLASNYAYQDIMLTVIGNVSSSYVRLRQFDAQMVVSRDTATSREEYLKIAQLRYDEGFTSELPVIQAKTELEAAKIAVKRLEKVIAIEENLISLLIGAPPSSIPRGSPLDQIAFPDEIPVGLPSDLLCRRPDILSAEARLSAAGYSVAAARADFFPRITLTGFYGSESAALKNLLTNPAEEWQIAAGLLQPIFNAGRISAQVDYANAVLYESYAFNVQTTLNAFREVEDALSDHQKSKELLKLQKDQVREFVEYLRLATLQYDNGETDYLNVLDAQRRLFEAQLEEQAAQADVYFSMIELYRALGGGFIPCNSLQSREILQGDD